MRPHRLATIAVLGALGAPATAAADVPALAGETVISGDRSGYVVVDLKRPLYLDPRRPEKTVAIEGSGDIIGAYLRPDRALTPYEDTLIATRSALYPQAVYGLVGRDPSAGTAGPTGAPQGVDTLPEGRYRLYLIADGAPVSVTIRDPKGTGRVELRPDVAVEAVSAPLTDRGGTPGAELRFGSEGRLATDGVMHVSARYSFSPITNVFRNEACYYERGERGGDQAYMPTCPGGGFGSGSQLVGVNPAPTTWTMDITAFPFVAGSAGLGGNISGAGTQSVRALGLWLPADGVPISRAAATAPPAPAPPAPVAPGGPKTIVQPGPERTRTVEAPEPTAKKAPARRAARKAKRCRRVTRGKRRAAARRCRGSDPRRGARPRRAAKPRGSDPRHR